MRRHSLTPLSGELRTETFPAKPPRRRPRLPRLPERPPPKTRLGMILVGLRRFAVALALLSGATLAAALLIAHWSSLHRDRAVTLGFYLAGAFLVVGGLLSGAPAGAWSERTAFEVAQTRRWAPVLASLGVGLIVIGLLVDGRQSLW